MPSPRTSDLEIGGFSRSVLFSQLCLAILVAYAAGALLSRPCEIREREFHRTADRLIVALPCDIQLTGFFDGGP